MRRAEYQGAVQSCTMGRRSCSDGHHGFAGAHFSIDNGGGFVFLDQLLQYGTDDFPLCRKQWSGKTIHHFLQYRIGLSVIDGPVLFRDGIEQAFAEFGQKLRQRHVGIRLLCFGGFLGCFRYLRFLGLFAHSAENSVEVFNDLLLMFLHQVHSLVEFCEIGKESFSV